MSGRPRAAKEHPMSEQGAPDEVRLRMEELRGALGHNLQETVENARTLLDWRYYVKAHPWVCVGAAAAAGFLMVPRRPKMTHPGPADLAELAKRCRLVVEAPPGPGVAGKWGSALLEAAVGMVLAQLGRQVQRFWDVGPAGNAAPGGRGPAATDFK
jgi:hypothetical protein